MTIFTDAISLLANVSLVPTADPLGYPIPAWLVRGLAYLTLTLHFLAVHFTVGGVLLLVWTLVRRQRGYKETARYLGAGLPLGVSYLITLGIPPLLFVQVLYGQYFYSSSILIGAFWIQVIPVLILVYGGFYYNKFSRNMPNGRRNLVVAVCALLLLYVGFIYVNNLTLAQAPEKWEAIYASSPEGTQLTHQDPTVHSRMALILAGAFAIAGLGLIWRGTCLENWGMVDAGQASRRFGFQAMLLTPILWVVAAVAWLSTRSEGIEAIFDLSAIAYLPVVIWAVCAAGMLFFAFVAMKRVGLAAPLLATLCAFLTTACMVVLRDLHRVAKLAPTWDTSMVNVNAQWTMFILFAIVLVGGLGLVIGLLVISVPSMLESARKRMLEEAGQSPQTG